MAKTIKTKGTHIWLVNDKLIVAWSPEEALAIYRAYMQSDSVRIESVTAVTNGKYGADNYALMEDKE